MGRKPAKVRGLKWREDRGTWEARYDVNGKRVRKSFTDRSQAIVWIEMARGLKHKEGLDSLPTSASEPLLTVAEKKARREEQVNRVTLGDLCDQYLAHIQNPNNPERPKDQRNPPQRVATIKAAFGDRPAASLSPTRSRTGSYPSDSQLLPSTDTSRPFRPSSPMRRSASR